MEAMTILEELVEQIRRADRLELLLIAKECEDIETFIALLEAILAIED